MTLSPFDKGYVAPEPKPVEAKVAADRPRASRPAAEPDDDGDEDAGGDNAERLATIQAQADAIVDGIYFGLPSETYHAVRRLSTSALQKIAISPADFWKDSWLDPNPTVLTEEQEKKQNEARRVGSAYHAARLEPELFDQLYVRELTKKDYPRAGMIGTDAKVKAALKALGVQQTVTGESTLDRAYRLEDAGHAGTIWAIELAQWQETVGGRMPLSAKVYDEIAIDMTRIHTSGSINEKLSGGAAEVSIFWTDAHGLPMKARVDYLRADLWCDLKSFANPKRKAVRQVIADAFRYDRHYMQAVVYRDAIEHVRLGGLQIIGDATDDQRKLIAEIQIRPGELACHYVYVQKGGVPNLLAREVEFFEVPLNVRAQHAGASEEGIAAVEEVTRRRTKLHIRGAVDVDAAKREFDLYAQVYAPGEPWRPIEPEGTFGDIDFNDYWLEGAA